MFLDLDLNRNYVIRKIHYYKDLSMKGIQAIMSLVNNGNLVKKNT